MSPGCDCQGRCLQCGKLVTSSGGCLACNSSITYIDELKTRCFHLTLTEDGHCAQCVVMWTPKSEDPLDTAIAKAEDLSKLTIFSDQHRAEQAQLVLWLKELKDWRNSGLSFPSSRVV